MALPRIPEPYLGQVLNYGPRHHVNRHFTSAQYGRFWEDNSFEAAKRREKQDMQSKKRTKLKKLAQAERRKRREQKVRSLEASMSKDERKLQRLLEARYCTLPPLTPLKEQSRSLSALTPLPALSPVSETSTIRFEASELTVLDEESAVEYVHDAAKTVQRIARGYLGRGEVAKRQLEVLEGGAVSLQRYVRRRLAAWFVGRLALMRTTFTLLRLHVREARTIRLRKLAAQQLQAQARARQARKEAEEERKRLEKLKILQRRRLNRLFSALIKRRRHRHSAARNVQRLQRGRIQRARVFVMKKNVRLFQIVALVICRFRRCRRRLSAGKLLVKWLQPRSRGLACRRKVKTLQRYWSKRRRLATLSIEDVIAVFLHPSNLAVAYAETWRKHIVDGAMLESLDDADLVELGVTLRIHRRRLLDLAGTLRREGLTKDHLKQLRAQAKLNDDKREKERKAAADKKAAMEAAAKTKRLTQRRRNVSPDMGKTAKSRRTAVFAGGGGNTTTASSPQNNSSTTTRHSPDSRSSENSFSPRPTTLTTTTTTKASTTSRNRAISSPAQYLVEAPPPHERQSSFSSDDGLVLAEAAAPQAAPDLGVFGAPEFADDFEPLAKEDLADLY